MGKRTAQAKEVYTWRKHATDKWFRTQYPIFVFGFVFQKLQ